jgi:hypothetical protein
MKTAWPLAILSVALIAPEVQASGVLYKCVGEDGIPNYSSTKIAGQQCTVFSKYTAADSAPRAVKPVAATPAPAPVAVPATTSAPAATPVNVPANAGSVTTAAASGTQQTIAASAGKTTSSSSEPKFLRMGYSTTYTWVDMNGIKHFANRKPTGVASFQTKRVEYPIFSIPSCYACGVTPGVNFGNVKLNMNSFANEIRSSAQKHGVEEAIVRAIIHAESAYRPHVVSPKNAQGLMQLIPATARRFGVTDAFDPAQNIEGGTQYLAWLLKRYNNDLTLASAAYNAGEGAVDRHGGVPPYRETRNYVQRVAQLAERYRKQLSGG